MAEDQEYPAARYRLRSESYMPRMPGFEHELLAPGTEVVWTGRPGPHLEPLDAVAAQNYEASGAAGMSLDPFASIPLTNAATDDDILAERIARAMGPAMISALGKLGFIKASETPEPQQPAPQAPPVVQPIPVQAVPEVMPPPPPAPPAPEVMPPPPPAPPVMPPPAAAPAPQAKRGK